MGDVAANGHAPGFSEIAGRGEELLAEILTEDVKAAHREDFVTINVDTGDYAIAATPGECRRRLAAPPGSLVYLARVGYRAFAHFAPARRTLR